MEASINNSNVIRTLGEGRWRIQESISKMRVRAHGPPECVADCPAKAEFHICFSDYNGLNGLSRLNLKS